MLANEQPSMWMGDGLDWTACKVIMRYTFEGKDHTSNRRALVRSDTGAQLGIVSDGYRIVQPKELLLSFGRLCRSIGFKITKHGSLRGGRRVCAFAETEDAEGFELPGDDRVIRNLLLMTSYDRSTSTQVLQTSMRVACWNQLRTIMSDKVTAVLFRLSHMSREVGERLEESRWTLDADWDIFRAQAYRLADTSVLDFNARRYFMDVLYPDRTEVSRSMIRKADRLFDIYKHAPGQELPSAKGTAWGMVNAVSYWTDHGRSAKMSDNRRDQAWFGRGAEIKARALRVAGSLLQAA